MLSIALDGTQINVNGQLGSAGVVYVKDVKLTHSKTGRRLRFVELISEHTPSFPKRARIELYDTSNRTDPSPTPPGVRRFFGYVSEIKPRGRCVEYTCDDPLQRLHEAIAVDTDGAPRLVLNARFDEYDFPDSLANTYRPDFPAYRVAEIWRQLLELHEAAIRTVCPGLPVGDLWRKDLADADGNGDTADMLDFITVWNPVPALHEDMKFEPEHLVFEEQTLADAFSQLLEMTPAWELQFDPETLLFRWLLRTRPESGNDPMPAETRTLNKINDPDADFRRPVLSKELGQSAQDRWTRVEIIGPLEQVEATLKQSTGDLIEDWDHAYEAAASWSIFDTRKNANIAATNPYWRVYRQYKIADPEKRRIARSIREGIWVPGLPGVPEPGQFSDHRFTEYFTSNHFRTHRPTLTAKFTIEGRSGWFNVPARFDLLSGLAIAVNPLVLGDIRDPATTFAKPDDVALAYAYLSAPVLASYPVTPGTYAGTAYTTAGVERTVRFYEQDFFSPASQRVNYQRLAKALWRTRGDLIFSGSIVVHGIDYSFEGFNVARQENYGRLNLSGLDDTGTPATTGWEAMDAPVQEVEYDYGQNRTTISFNSDWADFVFGDFASLKMRVKAAADQGKIVLARFWSELGGRPGVYDPGIDLLLGEATRIQFDPFNPLG
jgi:hypothetical protein